MQYNPLGRESARDSAWRQSSGEAMLSGGREPDWPDAVGAVVMVDGPAHDVDRQSAAWDVESGGGGGGGGGFTMSQEPLKIERRRRRPKRTNSGHRDRDQVVPLRESEMDRAATGRRSSDGSMLSRLTRSSTGPASPDAPPPARRPGCGKGWSALRKAHLERKLEAVGQREQENYRREGRAAGRAVNAFSSKLLGVFQYHVDADDDEDTGGEGQILKYPAPGNISAEFCSRILWHQFYTNIVRSRYNNLELVSF